MRHVTFGRILACWLALLLGTARAAAEEAAEPASESGARARMLMKQMSDYLGALGSLGFEAHTSYDALQGSGQTLEFGGIRRVEVRRPDRLRVRFDDREGGRHVLLFDGARLVFHSPDEGFYGEKPYEGDLEGALDHAVEVLNQSAPLADFVRVNFWQDVGPTIRSALVVGDSTIDGVSCHHLAFQGPEVDWQVWIPRDGPPLPRRVVITYNSFPGGPQFRARFVRWDPALSLPDSRFAFEPGDAMRIPIVAIGEPEPTDEGAQP